jgi:hypothetical protein
MISELLAKYGCWSGTYKEAQRISELPDLCLLMVDYKGETSAASGRHVLFHRQQAAGGLEYVIDPHPSVPAEKAIKVDLSDLKPPLWHIPVQLLTGSK